MKEHIWQTIMGQPPSKSNSYRIVTISGHGSLAKTPGLRSYENAFYMQVGSYRDMNIAGYFELHLRVYFASMSHDLDNSLKIILDSVRQDRGRQVPRQGQPAHRVPDRRSITIKHETK